MSVAPLHVAAEKLGDEYSVKGAYLLNFAKFTQFPEGLARRSSGRFVICSWRNSPLRGIAKTLESKTVLNLPVRIAVVSELGDIRNCDILFVTTPVNTELAQLLPAAEAIGTLVISETSRAAMINFVLGEEGEVRFECDLQRAARAGITFSSQLIKLAVQVEGGDAP